MDIMIIDIWLCKIINYSWKTKDAPNKKIRQELRKILKKERRNLENDH